MGSYLETLFLLDCSKEVKKMKTKKEEVYLKKNSMIKEVMGKRRKEKKEK